MLYVVFVFDDVFIFEVVFIGAVALGHETLACRVIPWWHYTAGSKKIQPLVHMLAKLVVFHQRSPSTEGRPLLKGVLPQRSSSTEGRLPPKVFFHQWSSSTDHRRSSSTEGCPPPKVVFHRRSSYTKGCLPPMVVFHQRSSSPYHNTLVDLIFVRTVTNLSLQPCLEVA